MRRILFAILVAVTLAGCHSRKAAVERDDIYARPSRPDSPIIVSPPKGTAEAVIAEARRWLGTPYKYGGNDRGGVDCSGLTTAAYRDGAGIALPRSSSEQAAFARPIDIDEIRPGDLVFFSSSQGGDRINHVAIYLPGDSIIHATTSRGVIITPLTATYWSTHYHSCGRVIK